MKISILEKNRAPSGNEFRKGLVVGWERMARRESGGKCGQPIPPVATRLRHRGVTPIAVVLLGRNRGNVPADLVGLLSPSKRLGVERVPSLGVNVADVFLLVFRSAVGAEKRLMLQKSLVLAPELAASRAALAALVVGWYLSLRVVDRMIRIDNFDFSFFHRATSFLFEMC